MVLLPRGVAGACARLARLCLAGRPRGPAPPAACRVTPAEPASTLVSGRTSASAEPSPSEVPTA